MAGFRAAAALTAIAAVLNWLPTPVVADVPLHTDLEAYQNGELGDSPSQGFHSSPIRAPIYQVNKFDHEKTDTSGYLFMTGRYGAGFGASIVSSKDLSLVWADENYDFAQAAQPYNFMGQPVIGTYAGGASRIYNDHYRQLYVVHPQGDLKGVYPDSHETYLTKDDTVVQIVCPEQPADLTPIGGPAEGAKVLNCHVQEVDPVRNTVLFQFATLDYFNIGDTFWPYQGKGVFDLGQRSFDFCHMNSAQKTPDGDFLISYRHLSSIILVDGKTRQVKWAMGGRRNQFRDITEGNSATFAYQHDPRITGKNRFTLFDNAGLNNGFCPDRKCSRGLELEYDDVNMTVKVVNEWNHPQHIMSASRGGVQRLPNGNTLVAWGQNAMYTEHTPDGEVVMDIQRSRIIHDNHGIPPIIAYRAFKGQWVGRPQWGPNISALAPPQGAQGDNAVPKIYVSWNGATEVDQWVLLASDKMEDLNGAARVVAQSPRMGFETEFKLSVPANFARIAALDVHGAIIGNTPAVDVKTGKLFPLDYRITEVKAAEQPPAPAPPPPPPANKPPPADDGDNKTPPANDDDNGNADNTPAEDEKEDDNTDAGKTEPGVVGHDGPTFFDKDSVIAAAPFYIALLLTIAIAVALVLLIKKRRPTYERLNHEDTNELSRFKDESED